MTLEDAKYNIEFILYVQFIMSPPYAAVAALIINNNQILIGERIDKNATCWQLPGGYIKQGESPEQAIIREVEEETNLHICDIEAVALTNNVFDKSNHSISLVFKCICDDPTKLLLKEPDKCQQWTWEKWENLPNPLFLPLHVLVESGYHPLVKSLKTTKKQLRNHVIIF